MTAKHLVAVLPAALALAFGCTVQSEDTQGDGSVAPEFTLPDLAGNEVRLSDFRGRTVVLDFWATWCPPCVFQIPELNALWKAHEAAGDVAVIGIAVDVEGAEVVAPWIEEQGGVDYPILLGDEELARDFGVLGFPTLVLIDPAGRVESLHAGLKELDELEELVAPLTGSSPAAAAPGAALAAAR